MLSKQENILEEEIDTKIKFGSAAFKKYFFNTSWLLTERTIRLIINFVVQILIIRYLGPSNFGLLSYALSFVAILSAIATLGLESLITRELVNHPEKENEILGTALGLRLLGAISSVVLIILLSLLIEDSSLVRSLIIIIGFSTLFQSFYIIDFYFQSKVLAKFSAYVYMISTILISLFKIGLIIVKASLIYFAITYLLESIILAIGFVLFYVLNIGKSKSILLSIKSSILKWKFKLQFGKNLLYDSWPLLFASIAIMIYMRIDQLMLKYMLDETQVGYYASAVKLCESWYFVSMAITNSLFPAILNARKNSNKLYLNRLKKLYDLLAWIAIGLAIPVTIFSNPIIEILYGSEFIPASIVLTIYIWASVPTFLGVASSQYLIAENFTKLSFYRTLIGMIVNIILNLIFIPIWGITGSAVATLISYSAATFFVGFNVEQKKQTLMMFQAILFIDAFKFFKFQLTKSKNI